MQMMLCLRGGRIRTTLLIDYIFRRSPSSSVVIVYCVYDCQIQQTKEQMTIHNSKRKNHPLTLDHIMCPFDRSLPIRMSEKGIKGSPPLTTAVCTFPYWPEAVIIIIILLGQTDIHTRRTSNSLKMGSKIPEVEKG